MTIEDLKGQGWELTHSGASSNPFWGKHVVHLKHSSGRMVHGYGDDEALALEYASKTIGGVK